MPRRTYLTNKIAILLTVALISFILAVLCTDNYINNNGSSLKNIIIFWCVFVISFILFLVYNNKYSNQINDL